MVRLKFARLVSFSSEDPLCPASSLVSGGPGGKWRCREPGEKQAWVLLQLQQLSTITGIDIGNNGAALVEIQVGSSNKRFNVFISRDSLLAGG